ncbi:MAG: hypothetical protein PHD97_06650 [Bacteroidales bacterium]|nr:hypothetical protein [Bacteroidales bacterium]
MKIKFFISLAVVILLSACQRNVKVPDEINRFTAGADFIFRGTIQLLNTSTIDAEDPTNMAVVKVDKVISSSDNLREFEGQQITVRLKDVAKAKKEESRIFFTRTVFLGESIGVDEVGSFAENKYQDPEKQINTAKQDISDEKLKVRISSSELVVSGKIVSIRKSSTQYDKVSEHNPQWMEAEIEVTGMFKGAETKKITILFPGSDDEAYMDSPKYKEGDTGIFILRKNNIKMGDEKMFSMVFKQDFLDINQSEKIKILIKK